MNNKGLTIPEVMISMVILLSIFVGVMYGFLKCMELNELSQNTSTATVALHNKLTEIEKTAFALINSTYDHQTFTVSGLNGIGAVFVDDSDPDLLAVKTVFCWQEKNGRVIGEDQNLNGQLDAGEDANGNGELDSVVELTTMVENI